MFLLSNIKFQFALGEMLNFNIFQHLEYFRTPKNAETLYSTYFRIIILTWYNAESYKIKLSFIEVITKLKSLF